MQKSKSKKILNKRKYSNLKFDKLNAKKLIKFLNSTLKTSFKYNEKKNNLSKIALNSHYRWDSLSHVKLLNAIEKKFKISVNENSIDQFSNLELTLNYLNKKKLVKYL
jgi:acyl carrier protein